MRDEVPELRMDRRLAAFELNLKQVRRPASCRQICAAVSHVLPCGDEQVLHHGHARLQWLVSAK